MNYFKHLLVIFFVVISFKGFTQDFKVNYSKGNSLLFFDLESKTKLSSSIGLSLHHNKGAFGLNYINYDFSYAKKINSIEELPINYNNKIHTLNLSYYFDVAQIEKVKFALGFNVSISNFEINTNLENAQGLNYADFSFEDLNSLGYFSENNYESSLSALNLDGFDEYPTYFFSFGPAIGCSYEIVDNFEISAKTIYRKNMTDLLDNINIENTRDITANSQDDNQLDFFLGITFNLSANKTIDNDSLVDYIYSITEEDYNSFEEISDNNEQDTTQQVIEVEENTTLISKNEYILNLLDLSTSVEDNDQNEEVETIVENDILTFEEMPAVIDEAIEDTVLQTPAENKSEKFYVIVGVFSEKSNLNTFANSLNIEPSNYFIENNLHYLYALDTDELSEARQLRNSLSIECWIYYAK
tara:strand:- start:5118 stop:6359 length:1242 start_codon:yes stop_codon:yes gene_type:complete